jgi:cell division protein FtsB
MDLSRCDAESPRTPSASRLDALSRLLRPTLVFALLAFATGVVFGNVLPTRAVHAATERRLEEQRRANEAVRRRIAYLDEQATRLAKDPWLTERILRDELKMSAPGEVIVR